ncbi:peroxiredoxin q [Lentinula edodes]|uniref:Peroxiredoxin q n=1 Tax=Lentinula edodes TaxID=5353 RepID=A0A1Q3EII2_LENED|nr:peroxiredoxin q [Lentinula edodes]
MTIILGWYPEGSSGAKRDEAPATHSASIPCSTSPSPQPQSIVKIEPSTPPPILQFLHSPDVEPEPLPSYGWKHPAELQYFTPEDWLPTKLIFYLIANAFSVPPRASVRGTPFFLLTRMNGETVTLPVGYRIPLLFLARFQWLSLKLVLTASSRETEWNEYKFSILHVSRLCTALLDAAQEYVRVSSEEGISKGMDRKWRCATFDRALARYRLKWFISGPEQVEEFYHTVGEDEYSKDAVKFDWRRWAIKGHRGFTLTDDEITIGITAEQFLVGLKQKNVDWYWDTEDHPILNGIDAWSLRALASSVSPSASELPSTYSQTPPGSKPVEPVTVATTAVESVPTGNTPMSSSSSSPFSSQEHKNVSNSNFVPVPNSNGPSSTYVLSTCKNEFFSENHIA